MRNEDRGSKKSSVLAFGRWRSAEGSGRQSLSELQKEQLSSEIYSRGMLSLVGLGGKSFMKRVSRKKGKNSEPGGNCSVVELVVRTVTHDSGGGGRVH
jgi:hypothetical protein